MPDEWGLDDWEDEAFDEDVWDASQLEEEGAGLADGAHLDGGGGPAGASPLTGSGHGGGGVAWSAWDIGTVFALGGWLADHHAAETARQVAAALAGRNSAATDLERPRGAAHPPPATGYHYGAASGSLRVGAVCDPTVLFAELESASRGGRDLMVWLQGPGGSTGPLSLVVSAVPGSSGPQLWVVAEGAPNGFAASRLLPVFAPEPHGGFALFATDHPHEAVDAAVWACQREGVALEALTVTERRAASLPRDAGAPPSPRLLRSAHDSLTAGQRAEGAGTGVLQPGETVDAQRLPGTLHDALVGRGLGWASGQRDTAWTDEPTVWLVTVEGEAGAHVSFHPLPLDRRWVRAAHPALSSPWRKHSVIDHARRQMGAGFPLEKAWQLVEDDARYDAMAYGLTVDAGDMRTTLDRLVRELDAAMRAFGTGLETTRLRLGKTDLEAGADFAAALARARRRT